MSFKTTANDFLRKLSQCTSEVGGLYGGLSSVYPPFFAKVFGTANERIHNCDDYFKLPKSLSGDKQADILIEYKYGVNLSSKTELSAVLAQCAYYIRRFIDNGKTIPTVVAVCTERQSVFLSGEMLWKATANASDFSLSPSAAFKGQDKGLIEALSNWSPIRNLFIFDMDILCDIEGIIYTISNIAKAEDGTVLIDVTERNIDKIWLGFKEFVFGRKKSVSPNEQVSIFVHYITNHRNFIIDDTKGMFSLNGNTYKVADPISFKEFRRHFGYLRSTKQKERLRATCDRFIEDITRRRKGEFYTPTLFVDYAHAMLDKLLGEDWRTIYLTWDPASGTCNLTRDYKFGELYCSTLEQGELEIAKGVNLDAVKFQFDFLNDPFENLPKELQRAFMEKRRIVFIVNPPYGTANSSAGKHNGIKYTETAIGKEMKKVGLGSAQKELFAQFLYRIASLRERFDNDITLALFCNPKFLTSSRFAKFRNLFFKNFSFEDGVIFNAGHFADVSASWGISLSVWKSGETKNKTAFSHKVIDVNTSGDIVTIGEKSLYNTDGKEEPTSYWKNPIRNLPKDTVYPSMSNALNVVGVEKLPSGSFGTIFTSGTCCSQFTSYYWMLSGASNHMGNAVPVTPANARQCCDIMAVAKLAECNWLTDKDELMLPNTAHPRFKEFSDDALVFFIFNGLASSLREVEGDGKIWNIKNEFFWLSREDVLTLADKWGFEELYTDAKESEERYGYKTLKEINLSPEAKAVLDKATDIFLKSFEYREEIHAAHPEWHLNAWDAGWYQIKKLMGELPHLKDEMTSFKDAFKVLTDKMRPMVYDLGFLKK